jgi:hypothetical protein
MSSENETSFISKIRGSLTCSVVLLGLDVAVYGSYLISNFIGPIWLVVVIAKALKALTDRTSWRVAVTRIVIALVTLALVLGNAKLQMRIAEANAERIIKACTQYRDDNGVFPETLTMLVPKYMKSVPRAQYALMGKFYYKEDKHQLNNDEILAETKARSLEGKFDPSPKRDVALDRHTLMWTLPPPFYRKIYTFETASSGH